MNSNNILVDKIKSAVYDRITELRKSSEELVEKRRANNKSVLFTPETVDYMLKRLQDELFIMIKNFKEKEADCDKSMEGIPVSAV